MKKRKHSRDEISTMLAQADELGAQGKLQSEIAKTLGVSVMTLHRWRKSVDTHAPALAPLVAQFEQEIGHGQRITEVQLENSRLRRLVTDLLLEKIRLEETLQNYRSPNPGSRRSHLRRHV
jgi:putative transposase